MITAAVLGSSVGGPSAAGPVAPRPACPITPAAGTTCLRTEGVAGGGGGPPPSNASSEPEFGSAGSVALSEAEPAGMVYVPTCGCLYLVDGSYSGEVQLIRNSSVVGNVSLDYPAGGVVYSPTSGEVYAALSDGMIDVLNGTTILRTIDLPDYGPGCGGPMAYDPADGDIVIGCSAYGGGPDAVLVLDPESDGVVLVNLTASPSGLAYDPTDGDMVVVLNPGPGPGGLVFLNGTSVVANVSGSSFRSLSPVSAVFDRANGWLYVSDQNTSPSCSGTCGFVAVLNGTSLVATLGVGRSPDALAYDAVTGTVYCANGGSDNLTEIRGTSVLGSRPTGDDPLGLAYDPADEELYASNFEDQNLSVFSTYLTIDPLTATSSGSLRDAVDVGQSLPFASALAVPGAGGDVGRVTSFPEGGLTCGPVSLPANASPGMTVSFRCSGSAPGEYTVTLNVTDRSNTTVGVALAVTVYPALNAPIPSFGVGTDRDGAGPVLLDVGENLTLSEGPTGGTGQYTRFVWTLPPLAGECASESQPTITCQFGTQGNGTVEVTVSDSNGASARSGPLALDIESGALIATPPQLGPAPVEAGLPVTLTEVPEGGTAPYGPFEWQGLPFAAACPASPGANLTCTFPSAGTYTVEVGVTDANGATSTSGPEIIPVAPALRITSLSPSRLSVDVGQSYEVNASVAGGSGGRAYSWTGNGFVCAGAGGPDLDCAASQQGVQVWNLSVSDLAGAVVKATAPAVDILSDPEIVGGVKLSPATVELGGPLALSVDVLGGAGNDTAAWGDLPSGCRSNATSFSCTPGGPGTYRVSVVVVDGNGFTVTTSDVVLTVSAPPKGSVPPTGAVTEVGIGALAILVGMAGVWTLARRRRRRPG